MKFRNFFLSLFVTLILLSCSEKEEKVSLIKEDILEMQMIDAYNEGLKEFNEGDVFLLQKNSMRLNFCIHNLYGHLDQT